MVNGSGNKLQHSWLNSPNIDPLHGQTRALILVTSSSILCTADDKTWLSGRCERGPWKEPEESASLRTRWQQRIARSSKSVQDHMKNNVVVILQKHNWKQEVEKAKRPCFSNPDTCVWCFAEVCGPNQTIPLRPPPIDNKVILKKSWSRFQ